MGNPPPPLAGVLFPGAAGRGWPWSWPWMTVAMRCCCPWPSYRVHVIMKSDKELVGTLQVSA